MRRIITALGGTVLALALAGPVAAWSGIGVTISGPGSDGPISGTGEVLVPSLLVTSTLPGQPPADLGPKFRVVYSEGAIGPTLATQDLYPYAPGGPVAYSATPGAIFGHPFAAGWRQADSTVLDLLVAWGLPSRATAVAGSAGNGAPRTATIVTDAHERGPSPALQPSKQAQDAGRSDPIGLVGLLAAGVGVLAIAVLAIGRRPGLVRTA